jgi:hypothetical protein
MVVEEFYFLDGVKCQSIQRLGSQGGPSGGAVARKKK